MRRRRFRRGQERVCDEEEVKMNEEEKEGEREV